jgi:hypothetical protein
MPEAPKTSAVRGGVVVDIVSYEDVFWEDRMKDRVARLRAPLPFDVQATKQTSGPLVRSIATYR